MTTQGSWTDPEAAVEAPGSDTPRVPRGGTIVHRTGWRPRLTGELFT